MRTTDGRSLTTEQIAAEHQVAVLLCRLVNLQERDKAGLAPEASDIKLEIYRLDLMRAERQLERLRRSS